jgi:hypothetical protein
MSHWHDGGAPTGAAWWRILDPGLIDEGGGCNTSLSRSLDGNAGR